MFPKYEPIDERGAEMPNHSRTISNMVPNGIAPEDPAKRGKKLSMNIIENTTVGNTVAVMNAFFFASVPPSDL